MSFSTSAPSTRISVAFSRISGTAHAPHVEGGTLACDSNPWCGDQRSTFDCANGNKIFGKQNVNNPATLSLMLTSNSISTDPTNGGAMKRRDFIRNAAIGASAAWLGGRTLSQATWA